MSANTTAWRPASGLVTARNRAAMLHAVREYFAAQSVLEIDSPVLSRSAVSDPQIESVQAQLTIDTTSDFFLHTSPEFAMKRLLCSGFPDIYQVCKVFRDGEVGRQHQPEFTMLEWYRLDFGMRTIIDDTLRLLTSLLQPERLHAEPDQLTYRDAFLEFTGVDPLSADIGELIDVAKADATLIGALGDNRDDWLNLLLSQNIAPQFSDDRLTVLHHYPASQAALSRLCPEDPAVADRFEVFYGSLEVANGYVELTDAVEQKQRFANDQDMRKAQGKAVRPIDQALIAALEAGMPACAGVAVGIDRLLMINQQADDIRNILSFAFEEREIAK